MQDKNIFMSGADVGELEIEYVTDALRNGWYEDKYYYCEKFQDKFANFHDRKFALMTPNCTSAIHLLLAALGVGPGDEVIIPECTWIATSVSTVHLGATPIFGDIEKKSWCLDPASVERLITEKTKAIIAVDLFGNMANWGALDRISKKYNIPLIEDAAEAIGSTQNGIRAGKFGVGSVFSFHNTKTMTTGEGGMLLLDDKALYDQCVLLRDLGRGPNTQPYFNETIGYKFMPFNVQAALGLAQFERLDELVSIKRKHFERYRDSLGDLDLTFNHEPPAAFNSAWITAMVLGESYKMGKQTFIEQLQLKGIPSRPFFYPLSSIPAYNQQDIYASKNKVAYDIASRGINLPGAMNLTHDHLDLICEKVREVLVEA
jgi:perosamine synthetase